MENKHTAGNWDINQEENTVSEYRIYSTLDGRNVGWFDGDYESSEETEANAKLIAAAPELLKALQSVMNDLPFQPTQETYNLIESAINKATN